MIWIRKMKKRVCTRNRIAALLMIMVLILAPLLFRPAPVQATGGQTVVACGGNFTALLKSDGTVWTWGGNYRGQLGDGTQTNSSIPLQVQGLSGKTITQIAAGKEHMVALDSEGKVWAWGNNYYKQLGDGTETDSFTPVQVQGLSGTITAISAKEYYTMALDSEGKVWAWGSNSYGQLGNGTSENNFTPVQVQGLSGKTISAIAAGRYDTAALASDGTVWTCGRNSSHQLGDGTTTLRKTMGQVQGLDGVHIQAISVGKMHMAALDNSGNVWTWGSDTYGELGVGTTTFGITGTGTPEKVPGLTDFVAISTGDNSTAALDSAGKVWTWGYNNYGQLGNGTTADSNTPLQVGGLSGAVCIAAGESHMAALKNEGTLWTWGGGYDNYGLLGNGTTQNSSIPVRVFGTAVVSSAVALMENNLNGGQLTLHVDLDSFKSDLSADQFILNNAPAGTTVTNAVYSGGDCVLTLGFNGDFDANINNFSVTIQGAALNSGQAITTSSLSITAINELHVTPNQALTEKNLDGRTLTVDLQTGSYFVNPGPSPGTFTLNNAPPGLSIAYILYFLDYRCEIYLASDGSDFDSDFTDCSITIAGSEVFSGNPQTTDKFTVTAVQESATVTANQSLEENSLNGSLLSVILQNDTFKDGSLDKANFNLNNAPAGLSVGSVFYNDPTHCVVTLSYDGTPFTSDINDFSLTIKAAEMSSKGDVSGNNLTLQVRLATGAGKYTVSPVADSCYTNGTTADGIVAMTVNSGISGLKYFTVDVTPVVFVHLRNGTQLNINAASADFDSMNRATAGFNVQSGDVIKAYIVDDLTKEEDFNPTLLQ